MSTWFLVGSAPQSCSQLGSTTLLGPPPYHMPCLGMVVLVYSCQTLITMTLPIKIKNGYNDLAACLRCCLSGMHCPYNDRKYYRFGQQQPFVSFHSWVFLFFFSFSFFFFVNFYFPLSSFAWVKTRDSKPFSFSWMWL